MKAISAQRNLHKALTAPLAAGSLVLIAACGGDDGADEPDEGPVNEETTEETAEDAGEDDAEADAEADADETAEDDDAVTMDEVEENNTPESCWAVMDGTVYDLTDWIDQHPGGEERIEQLCGTEAGDAFDAQHGGQDGPEGQLSEFEIGSLEG